MPTIMPPPSRPDASRPSLGQVSERLRQRRASIIGFGVISALLGVIALVLVETATVASVLTLGVFMMLAGLAEVVIGFRTKTWGRMLLREAAGVFYIAAGLSIVIQPELASVIITLVLGAGLLATGAVRVVVGFRLASAGARGGIVVAGLITMLLGFFIVIGWPGNSVLVLGTLLGVDLLLYGITWIVLGVRLGRHGPAA